MEITKIVVGIDFSEQSGAAIEHALEIARHTGAQIVLVHVGTVLDGAVPQAPDGTYAEWERLIGEQLNADRDALHALRKRYSGQGAEVSHMVIDGFPDTGLLTAAKEIGAELIVTGSHGRTGLSRWLLGSVAERTVRLSNGAVLVARGSSHAAGGYHNILVPSDLSDCSEQALSMAMIMAAPGATIDLVHYWQLPMVSAGGDAHVALAHAAVEPVVQAIESDADRRGRELVEKHAREGINLRFSFVQAGAAHGIVDRIESDEHDYDLCVLGSHGRRGFRRFILGSVAESVVRHAQCSVMVVHGRGEDQYPSESED